MSEERGALALVLHSHMPYVEGYGTWPFGEEWLWETVATVYLPLAALLERTQAPLTLGLTPVLCDQLELLGGAAGERLLGFLDDTRAVVHAQDASGLERAGEPALAAEVRRAAADYSGPAEVLRAGGSLLDRLAAGAGELWTSAATHSVLPLLATDAGLRLQLETGIAAHTRRFGSFGGGFWLPECAYEPGLERELADHGVRVTCVDQTDHHGLGSLDALTPVETEAGVLAVPIDWSTVGLVWSDGSGYPADGAYRDYHHRTIHDLRPWANSGKPYDAQHAAHVATRHAGEFVDHCIARLGLHRAQRGGPGLICCALDTELLGHWWYEGLTWLEAVFAAAAERGLELTTLGAGVERVDPRRGELAASTWGRRRDLSTWDSPRVAELAFGAREAELRVVAAAARPDRPDGDRLARAARELLALQSSDWAFGVSYDMAAEYAPRRAALHGAALTAALEGADAPPQEAIGEYACDPVSVAALRNLAPDLELSSLLAP